jgi:hypothetical protein
MYLLDRHFKHIIILIVYERGGSMRKEFYLCGFVAITLFGIFRVVNASTFIVPLEAEGSYVTGQETLFEFDLGVMLSDVNEVVFVCNGTITAGVSYIWTPFSWLFSAYLDADTGYMLAEGPWAGEDTFPSPEPFTGQPQFRPHSEETWDFLLDGHATGRVSFPAIYYIPEFPPREFPYGYLSSASIIVNADLLGDFDANGEVDFFDFSIFALAWSSSPGDDNWNPRCDISDPSDNVIDELDLDAFTHNWLAGK